MFKLLATQKSFRPCSVAYSAANVVHSAWLATYQVKKGNTPRFKNLPGCSFNTLIETQTKLKELCQAFTDAENQLVINSNSNQYEIVQNIVVEPGLLHPSLHYKLSGQTAELYVEMIESVPENFQTQEGVMRVLNTVHRIWQKLNDWELDSIVNNKNITAARLALFVGNFSTLPPKEQLKDINVIEPILRNAFPEINLTVLYKVKAEIQNASTTLRNHA